ncbi:hypothetical protein JAAN108728_04460 [Janibacter anophelis]
MARPWSLALESLNINIFWSLAHAKVVISDWKEDYNRLITNQGVAEV